MEMKKKKKTRSKLFINYLIGACREGISRVDVYKLESEGRFTKEISFRNLSTQIPALYLCSLSLVHISNILAGKKLV